MLATKHSKYERTTLKYNLTTSTWIGNIKEIGVTMATVKSFAQMSAVLDLFVGSKTSTVEKE